MRRKYLFLTTLTLTLLFFGAIYIQPTAASNFSATSHSGNMEVTCYTSPDSSYDVTLDAIRSADESIYICIYAVSNGFILHELNELMEDNPSITMNVIFSYRHASGFETAWTRGALYNLSQAIDNTGATNVNLFESSNTYDFTHAKYMIVDEEVVLVQSGNWAKTGVPIDPSYGNREWGVMIKNNDVVDYFVQVFNNDMAIATPYFEDSDHEKSFSASVSTGSYSNPFSEQKFTGSMTIQTIVSPDNDVSAIRSLLQSAQNTIYVQQAYIKTDWKGDSNEFLDELEDAVDRGVTVKVIIDKQPSGAADSADHMESKGIEIAYSSNVFEYCHNKGVIVDNSIVLISSINWSYEAANENREAGVIIFDANVAGYFVDIFAWDWQNADIIFGDSSIDTSPGDGGGGGGTGDGGDGGIGFCLGTLLLGIIPVITVVTMVLRKRKH
jgi:phosphatidylserine/phosphatidylglycerophosphate/cardiolipin synthase-like enzyme